MSDHAAHFAPVRDLATELESEGFSGLLRVTRGEQVIFESCHGYANRADRIPIHPGTRFSTGSVGKVFTAVAILEAAGRGEVGIHDRVVDVLPTEKRPSTLRDNVTVHHLLSHTSGIADYYEEDEDLPGYREDDDELWRLMANYWVRDDADILPLFRDLPPNFPPGERYAYSNAGYVLLGMILAEVSGLSFIDAVTSRVLEPAGLTETGYPALDEVHENVAIGYRRPATVGGPWRTNIYSMWPVGGGDGGAVHTAADIERFLRALHRGGVWPGVTPEDMLTPRVHCEGRWWGGYALNLRDDGVFCKDGGDVGVNAFTRYRPATDTTVVALANLCESDCPRQVDLIELLVETADAEV